MSTTIKNTGVNRCIWVRVVLEVPKSYHKSKIEGLVKQALRRFNILSLTTTDFPEDGKEH